MINTMVARQSELIHLVMSFSSSSFGSSSVVFDGTTAYVIPTSELDSVNEELIKTFHCFEDAESFCDEYCEENNL